jgi:uncharacterized protein (DUF433 family)
MGFLLETQPVPIIMDCDGVARVGQTRVTLETVLHCYKQGHTPEDIARKFPSLQLADIYAVISYYLSHQAEVEAYLHRQAQEAEEIYERIEAQPGLGELRERLRGRRKG